MKKTNEFSFLNSFWINGGSGAVRIYLIWGFFISFEVNSIYGFPTFCNLWECSVTWGSLGVTAELLASSKLQYQEQLEILRKCSLVWQVYYPELHFQMWVQFRLTTVLLLTQLLACFPVLFVGMTVPVRVA